MIILFFLQQKFWQFAKQVTEFIQWKQVDCPYPRDRQALNYLLTAPVFSENCKYEKTLKVLFVAKAQMPLTVGAIALLFIAAHTNYKCEIGMTLRPAPRHTKEEHYVVFSIGWK